MELLNSQCLVSSPSITPLLLSFTSLPADFTLMKSSNLTGKTICLRLRKPRLKIQLSGQYFVLLALAIMVCLIHCTPRPIIAHEILASYVYSSLGPVRSDLDTIRAGAKTAIPMFFGELLGAAHWFNGAVT
ncbi:hypothetical protein IF1G_10585 [Cordyceps javanica]|uniref:Uncharacterized protein n=1 Tax=Cordyceps javanica TaxID=43265 RepID=A0A545UN08_9HYPO|nr:hypothetical protein IF1G_10585 [Cordyceps javanica]